MVIYRLYTNTLVTYEYIEATYDDRRVINMNFCLFISFLHVHSSCVAHTCKRAQVPQAHVPYTCAIRRACVDTHVWRVSVVRARVALALAGVCVQDMTCAHVKMK